MKRVLLTFMLSISIILLLPIKSAHAGLAIIDSSAEAIIKYEDQTELVKLNTVDIVGKTTFEESNNDPGEYISVTETYELENISTEKQRFNAVLTANGGYEYTSAEIQIDGNLIYTRNAYRDSQFAGSYFYFSIEAQSKTTIIAKYDTRCLFLPGSGNEYKFEIGSNSNWADSVENISITIEYPQKLSLIEELFPNFSANNNYNDSIDIDSFDINDNIMSININDFNLNIPEDSESFLYYDGTLRVPFNPNLAYTLYNSYPLETINHSESMIPMEKGTEGTIPDEYKSNWNLIDSFETFPNPAGRTYYLYTLLIDEETDNIGGLYFWGATLPNSSEDLWLEYNYKKEQEIESMTIKPGFLVGMEKEPREYDETCLAVDRPKNIKLTFITESGEEVDKIITLEDTPCEEQIITLGEYYAKTIRITFIDTYMNDDRTSEDRKVAVTYLNFETQDSTNGSTNSNSQGSSNSTSDTKSDLIFGLELPFERKFAIMALAVCSLLFTACIVILVILKKRTNRIKNTKTRITSTNSKS